MSLRPEKFHESRVPRSLPVPREMIYGGAIDREAQLFQLVARKRRNFPAKYSENIARVQDNVQVSGFVRTRGH